MSWQGWYCYLNPERKHNQTISITTEGTSLTYNPQNGNLK